jgi:hypothetical protein
MFTYLLVLSLRSVGSIPLLLAFSYSLVRGRLAIQRELLGDASLRERLWQEPLSRSYIAPFAQVKSMLRPSLSTPR